MDFGIMLKCPYCGFAQEHTVERYRSGKEVVTCENKSASPKGCGADYVLKWELVVQHTVYGITDENTKKQAAHDGSQ